MDIDGTRAAASRQAPQSAGAADPKKSRDIATKSAPSSELYVREHLTTFLAAQSEGYKGRVSFDFPVSLAGVRADDTSQVAVDAAAFLARMLTKSLLESKGVSSADVVFFGTRAQGSQWMHVALTLG